MDATTVPGVTGLTAGARERVEQARVARLATVRPDGSPHVVAVTFALDGDTVVTAVDDKPKRTRALQRLRNIDRHPAASLLVDHYEEDWSRLWWVRLDGAAVVVRDEPRRSEALAPLLAKYVPYRTSPPGGPVIVLTIRTAATWHAS